MIRKAHLGEFGIISCLRGGRGNSLLSARALLEDLRTSQVIFTPPKHFPAQSTLQDAGPGCSRSSPWHKATGIQPPQPPVTQAQPPEKHLQHRTGTLGAPSRCDGTTTTSTTAKPSRGRMLTPPSAPRAAPSHRAAGSGSLKAGDLHISTSNFCRHINSTRPLFSKMQEQLLESPLN